MESYARWDSPGESDHGELVYVCVRQLGLGATGRRMWSKNGRGDYGHPKWTNAVRVELVDIGGMSRQGGIETGERVRVTRVEGGEGMHA